MTNRQIIETALFTTIAVLLTFISIPMPIPAMANLGLKIDLSPIFIFLLFYRQGAKAGFISLFITMFLNGVTKPTPFYIGQIAYIMAILVFYAGFKRSNLKFATLITIIVMTLFNYIAITPIYTYAFSNPAGLPAPYFEWITSKDYFYLIMSVYPLFNLIQWGINATLINYVMKKQEKR